MRELFDARLNVDDKPMTPSQLAEALKIADVLVPTVTDRIDRAVISQAGPQLRLIANFGTGVDNIDLDTARNRGITRDQHAGRADRRYRRHDDGADPRRAAPPRRGRRLPARIRKNHWAGWSPTWMLGHRIFGKRLGIIGMGRIGQAVARRAKAFGLQIHYHNRRRVAQEVEQELEATLLGKPRPDADARRHRLGQLPAHAGTYHLLSARRLKLLKPSAYVVNTARGEVIDENELARLIEAGAIAGRGPRRVRARAGRQSEAARTPTASSRCRT